MKLKLLTLACTSALILGCTSNNEPYLQSKAISAQDTKSTYSPNAESIVNYVAPEWYQDAKIGYWVHWGVYSVPAYQGDHAAEWYGRWMYNIDDGSGNKMGPGFEKRGLKTAEHHKKTYGDPSKFGYKDFIPMWKAEKFNADEWADLFQEGGAKFFTMMGMHHDNFALYDSDVNPWNSVDMGPKRDFVAEMKRAIKSRKMKFGVSNHSAWNGTFFNYNHVNGFDAKDPTNHGLYEQGQDAEGRVQRWWERTIELAEKYEPDLYWFDWGWHGKPFTKQDRIDFVSHYYNKAIEWNKGKFGDPGVVVNYKEYKLPDGSAVLDVERGGLKDIGRYTWQNDSSLGKRSWSYAADEEYKSANEVIDLLADIVSKNGVLLLNFGPKADGSIPKGVQKTIRDIGDWLKINGEAIYATRPYYEFGEGPTNIKEGMHGDQVHFSGKDVRFTRSKDNKTLYATVLGWPEENLQIELLGREKINLENVKSVTLVGSDENLTWKQTQKAMEINMGNKPDYSYAYPIKIVFNDTLDKVQR